MMEEEREKKNDRIPLPISGVPAKAREAFIKLANEEFSSDYGMTLKSLVDERTSKKIDREDINLLLRLVGAIDLRLRVLEAERLMQNEKKSD